MNKPVVEANLDKAKSRWRRLRLLQHTSALAIVCCGLLLLLAWFLIKAPPAPPWIMRLVIGLVIFGALATWTILFVMVAGHTPPRGWLAGLVERGQSRLQDRLNTLVHLEKPARRNTLLRSFYQRIAVQTNSILSQTQAHVPLPLRRPVIYFWVAVAAIVATFWVYDRFSPWARYMTAHHERLHARSHSPAPAQTEPELLLPTNNVAEQKQAWGEVRITEPARDLQVTKVDVVPLQIEAAATDPLQKISWSSTINGRGETQHELPAPAEPRFAAYKPDVYLDEMGLADWDVVTYYAKANTDKLNSFASEVYFFEVRPFREDILKMPGGEGGQAYQCLNELTVLITRQQHIIRQTHQHVQSPPPQPNLETQDRLKLAEAETDLGESTRHLYAKMAGEMEGKPIREALDQLAKAEAELGRASKALTENTFPEAQNRERSALAELVAARKAFQKVVSENPSQFDDRKDEEPPGSSDATALKEIAEYRNQAKAAQDLINKTLAKERDIAQRARTQARTNYTRLAVEQRTLQSNMQQFERQNPGAFKEAQKEVQQATNAMQRAYDSLVRQNTSARTNAQQAVENLEKLQSAMQQKSASQQLADAHKLKEMLDRQVQTMQECQNSGDGLSSEKMQSTASQAQQTVQELKRAAEQDPTRQHFGPELQQALGETNMARINERLSSLKQSQAPEQRKEAAGQAGKELARVSDAFEKSLPEALQAAQKRDSLKGDPGESLDLGLAQLESLIKQLERQNDGKDRGKQGQEALYNLQTGLRNEFGSNERGNQIMVRVEQALKPGEAPDVANLRKLMEELQKFSLEMKAQVARKEEKVEVTNIDPASLPPAYRGRIQKYFQKLSEK